MTTGTLRTVRYALSWVTGRADVVEEDAVLDRDGEEIPATIIRPRRSAGPLPAWIALHGITRPGRTHAQLVRFTRAVASTGVMAIVPEVPEWRELYLRPGLTVPTVLAAISALRAHPDVRDEPFGLIGFSFGAPHAIAAAGHPQLRDDVAGAVGFGGYCDLERTIRFMMTGRHSWNGTVHELDPDPYGRWIVAGNYLTAVPDHEDAGDVADALRSLAALAGDTGAPAGDPVYDAAKEEMRANIAEERRGLFDLFAPRSAEDPDAEQGHAVAEALAAAARRVEPEIEPADALRVVGQPVHIMHGRHDNLIPFSEGLRLRAALPESTWSRATVTRLFGHSAQAPFPSPIKAMKEVPMFFRALKGVLGLI